MEAKANGKIPPSMKAKHPEFVVTLKALPSDTPGDEYRRLRAFLKAAARSWRLQCVAIRPATPAAEQATTEGTSNA